MSCIQEKIIGEIQDSIEAKQKVLDNSEILKTLELMADQITETLKKAVRFCYVVMVVQQVMHYILLVKLLEGFKREKSI